MTTRLEAIYDFLEEGFDPTDEIILEDTYGEMRKYWRDFLENGKCIDKVVEMMSPYDKFKNYDELIARGACIPIHLLARDLYFYNLDSQLFEEEFEWFLARGLEISDLAEFICITDENSYRLVRFLHEKRKDLEKYVANRTISEIVLDCWDDEDYEGFGIEVIEKYLEKGLDSELLFEVILNRVPKDWERFERRILDLCAILHKYGISIEMIERLLDEISDWDYVFFRMLDGEYEEWKALGLSCEKYAAGWASYVSEYCPEALFECLDEVPDELKKDVVQAALNNFTTSELMELMMDDPRELVNYLTGYGATAEELGKKYLDEVGYNGAGWLYCWYMLALLEKDKEALELEAVLQEVAKLDSEYGRSNFYGYLKDFGIPDERLSLLGIYPVTEE